MVRWKDAGEDHPDCHGRYVEKRKTRNYGEGKREEANKVENHVFHTL